MDLPVDPVKRWEALLDGIDLPADDVRTYTSLLVDNHFGNIALILLFYLFYFCWTTKSISRISIYFYYY